MDGGLETVITATGLIGSTLAAVLSLLLGAARIARSTAARLLASVHIAVAAGLWLNLADWNGSGCSDTPDCGWEEGFVILSLIWVAAALVTIGFVVESHRRGRVPSAG
jgi:hypothetical protein